MTTTPHDDDQTWPKNIYYYQQINIIIAVSSEFRQITKSTDLTIHILGSDLLAL